MSDILCISCRGILENILQGKGGLFVFKIKNIISHQEVITYTYTKCKSSTKTYNIYFKPNNITVIKFTSW